MIPTINKATRVTKTTSTLIDNILTNNLNTSEAITGVIETDVSDHFPTLTITGALTSKTDTTNSTYTTITKRIINDDALKKFQNFLKEVNWELIHETEDVNHAYDLFVKLYSMQYDKAFPEKKLCIKTKSLESPWITTALLKSSKTKQKLYERFLKRRIFENETKYKNYKNRFEKIKKALKKNHYSKQLTENSGNAKQTWNVIKELIGKSKILCNPLPNCLNVNDKLIYKKTEIANELNNFFVSVGNNLAKKIPQSLKSPTSYIKQIDSTMNEKSLEEKSF